MKPVRRAENTRFNVCERMVLSKMMGEEVWLKSMDKKLARIIVEHEEGDERFISEMRPQCRVATRGRATCQGGHSSARYTGTEIVFGR